MPSDRPLQAVVFDLDGTLIDSAAALRGALNQALGSLGRRALAEAEVTGMIGDGIIALTERALAATGAVLTGAALEQSIEQVKQSYALQPPSVLYGGARDLLSALGAHGMALALCTNKPSDATHRLLGALDLAGHFRAVAGGDSYATKKPDPAPVRALLAQLGVAPEAAIMIGDSANDIHAGRAAGLGTIAVSYGYSLVPPGELGADWVVDHLDEVMGLLHPRLPRAP